MVCKPMATLAFIVSRNYKVNLSCKSFFIYHAYRFGTTVIAKRSILLVLTPMIVESFPCGLFSNQQLGFYQLFSERNISCILLVIHDPNQATTYRKIHK